MRRIYVFVAIAVGIAIGVVIGYAALGHGLSISLSPSGTLGANIVAQACRYSFVRHFSTTLLMAYLSASTYGERLAKPIALSFVNGFLTPCFLSLYGYPKTTIRVWGNISIKSINVTDGKVTLGKFESMRVNFTIRRSGNFVEVSTSGWGVRIVKSSIRVRFYEPPLVSSEATNVTMRIATLSISRVSEYGYDRDETIKTYCAYEYVPSSESRSMSAKQCLLLSEEGPLLVNSSKRLGSREIYDAIKLVPKSVRVKQINSSTVELIVSYAANLKGFSINAYADELINLKDLGGAAMMIQCFAKEVRLSVTVGNETYTFSVDNQLLMKGSVSVK